MSQHTDPSRSDASGNVHETRHGFRRHVNRLGLEVSVGFRITGLPILDVDFSRPPLLPDLRVIAEPGEGPTRG